MTLEDMSVEYVGGERKLELVPSRTDESNRFALGVYRIVRSIDDIDTLYPWEESCHLVFGRKVFAAANRLSEEFLLLEDLDLEPLLGQVYCGGEATGAPSDNDHIVFTAGQADRSAIGGRRIEMAMRFMHLAEKVRKILMMSGSGETGSAGRFRSRRKIIAAVLIIALAVSGVLLYSLITGHHTSVPITTPALVGWGGVKMDESITGSGGTLSAVFPGEYVSDMELLLILMKAKDYNTVRLDFDPYCTDTVDHNYMSVYNQTNAQRAVQIANHYGFWIIIDYHGYSDVFRDTSCWLNYWKPIVQNIGPLYSQIIWEPENEPEYNSCNLSPVNCLNVTAPCSSDSSCVTYLGVAYQQWINQARVLGDNHWIVAQNLCSYACGFSDMSQGYPTVTDPLGTLSQGGRIFISLHSYLDYNQSSSSWTNATADALANQYYQAVIAGVSNTGWPALNTEGGTDTLSCDPNMCGPNVVLNGSAGYTPVTFHFIQSLVNLYDGNSLQRINWVWWPAGSWTNTPGAGTYGAMNCADNPMGWGCLLQFVSLSQSDFSISSSSPSRVDAGQSASSTITVTGKNGFNGIVTLTDMVPLGLRCGAITPSQVTGSGTATVSCSSLIASTYTLSITGANASLAHSTTATFNFKQQDFTITATSPAGVYTTKSATATISVLGESGFNGTVALAETIPPGLDCGALAANNLTGSGSTTVSCSSPTAGTYALNITGTSGPLIHSAFAVFRFKDFILTSSPPPPVDVGTSANSTINILGLNGFSGTVLFADTVPNGVTCGAISPNNITANGNATLSCNSKTQSVYSVTIQATSGSLSHSTNVSFAFGTPPNFAISSTQPLRVEAGSNIHLLHNSC